MFISNSAEETIDLGKRLGRLLKQNQIICFEGDLGAGKTTLIKGLAEGAGCPNTLDVNSPTFVYLNIYNGTLPIYHFDLYRLNDAEEFLSMGFDDYLYADGICCIEWSERIKDLLPPHCTKIEILHQQQGKRAIQITPCPKELLEEK